MQGPRRHGRSSQCAFLCALLATLACKSGGNAKPNVPGTLLDQQTVTITNNTQTSVHLRKGEKAATVIFPAGATETTQKVTVDLSENVDKQGATPANGTVIQIITIINITFLTPALMQETLPPPPSGQIYVAANAAPDDVAWIPGKAAREVSATPAGDGGVSANAQAYEIDILGTGIWTIVLVDLPGGTDAGATAGAVGSSVDADASTGAGGRGGTGGGSGKANGGLCALGSECMSANCVDGVCCGSPSCPVCQTCNNVSGPGACANIPADNFEPLCAPSPPCGLVGTCDGLGACKISPARTPCAAAACDAATSMLTAISMCNGAGACVPGATSSCAPYGCGPSVCKAVCVNSNDCAAGATCASATNMCQ